MSTTQTRTARTRTIAMAACALIALTVSALGFALPVFVVLQTTQWILYGLLAVSLVLVCSVVNYLRHK